MQTNEATRTRRPAKKKPLPVRDRILAATDELFRRQGIRDVGVEAIAEAAGTNKMTLYRHFESKNELVSEWVRTVVARKDQAWKDLSAKHAGDPQGLLHEWSRQTAKMLREMEERGCPLGNCVTELSAAGHPARDLILEYKALEHKRVRAVCKAAGFTDPTLTANLFSMMSEGAHSCGQIVGMRQIGEDLVRVVDRMISDGRKARTGRSRMRL